jgi:hypothetical protein
MKTKINAQINAKIIAIIMTLAVIFSNSSIISAIDKSGVNPDKVGYYKIYYVYDYEMYGVVADDPDNPPPSKTQTVWSGNEVALSAPALKKEGALFSGWREITTDTVYPGGEKYTMPNHDVFFEPYFKKFYSVTYLPGDVDGLTVSAPFQLKFIDGTSFETAASSRFSRTGYRLIGWTYDYTGEFFPIDAKVTMPMSDVTFVAVWEAAKYDITFGLGGGKGTVKTFKKAEYKSIIRVPLCSYTNEGKVFTGWKYKDVIYKPGDEFTVPSLATGIPSIIVNAQWEDGELPTPVNSTNLAIKKFEMLNGLSTADDVKAVKDFVGKPWASQFDVNTDTDDGTGTSEIGSDGEVVVGSDGEVVVGSDGEIRSDGEVDSDGKIWYWL